MSGTVKWKFDDPGNPGRVTRARPIANVDDMASALAEALLQHANDIEIQWDKSPFLEPRSWTVTWGTKEGIGCCALKGSETHLTVAVNEVLKRSPSEVSITERNSPAPPDPDLPHEIIAQALEDGEVVPFLGAGVPASARKPLGAEWSANSQFPPTGAELSEYLACMAKFPRLPFRERADLARVASFYSSVGGHNMLYRTLRRLFYGYSDPALVHKELANVSAPLLIVTTNYDALMEDALRAKKKPFDVVVHCTDSANKGHVLYWKHGASDPNPAYVRPNQLEIDLSKVTVVYKMHGSVDRFGQLIAPMPPQSSSLASFVITEEDYVDFLCRMNTIESVIPAVFMKYLKSKSFLFLGYGLRDWNFRVVLQNLRDALPTINQAGVTMRRKSHDLLGIEEEDRRHWAIQRNPAAADIVLWRERNVKIFDSDLDEFIEILGQSLQEIRRAYGRV